MMNGDLAAIVKKFADSGVKLQIGKTPHSLGFIGDERNKDR
jgi:hypothetical protein